MWHDVMITPLPRASASSTCSMPVDFDGAQQLVAFEPRQAEELEQHAVVARHHLQHDAQAFAPRTAGQIVARLTNAACRRAGKNHRCTRASPLASAYPTRIGTAAARQKTRQAAVETLEFRFFFGSIAQTRSGQLSLMIPGGMRVEPRVRETRTRRACWRLELALSQLRTSRAARPMPDLHRFDAVQEVRPHLA